MFVRLRITTVAALVLSAVLASALTLEACGGEASGPAIITTDSVAAEWARAVAGEGFRVEALVPPGTDVHTFTLAPDHVRLLREADLVILMGGGLEAAFEDALLGNARGRVLVLADHLQLQPFPEPLLEGEDGAEDHHDHGNLDPHFWLDVDLAAEAVRVIADELSTLYPDEAETFATNADAYIAQLREVDGRVRELLADLPPQRRYLVTFHDAYGYFARRYGLEILGFVVEGPEEEPSAARVAQLVERIRELGIDRIYREPQFSARVLEQIARETGAEVRDLPSHLTPEYDTLPELLLAMAEAIAAP